MRHALQLVPTSVHSRVAEVDSLKVDLRSAMRNDARRVSEVVLWAPKSTIYGFQAAFTSRLMILV